MTVDSKNEQARKVATNPNAGLSSVLERSPSSTIVTGGHAAVRNCVVSSLTRSFAENCSVFFLHCNNPVLSDKLAQSHFAKAHGGVVSFPFDPIGHCHDVTSVASLLSKFAEISGFPMSSAAFDVLEFYLESLMTLHSSITLPALSEMASIPPAKVLLTLLHEKHCTIDVFNSEKECMEFYINECPAVRRTVRRMCEIFRCPFGTDKVVPSLGTFIAENKIISIDLGELNDDDVILLDMLLHICTKILGATHSRAMFILDNVPSHCSTTLNRFLSTCSGLILKVILCSDLVSVCSGDSVKLKAVWSSIPNKIVLWRDGESADLISSMLGTCSQLRISTTVNKTKGMLNIFPKKQVGAGVQTDYNARRVEPDEIRSLDNMSGFIVTDYEYIIKTQVVS